MPAIPVKHTPTADDTWDGPEAMARIPADAGRDALRAACAWVDPDADPDLKGSYKFIHHDVSADGTVGAANIKACQSGCGVLNGGMGGTTIPAADREGVHAHLAAHLEDAGLTAPPLTSGRSASLLVGEPASQETVDTLVAAGVDPQDAAGAVVASAPSTFMRSYAVEDIRIRSGGDGRTVEAYAAVFGTPTSIRDGQGTYREQIAPTAFDRTIAHKGTKFGVFFNHGLTLRGRDSELGAVPIGTPVQAPVADSRGLLTVSRYNKSPLAESVLESIRNGDITGQSFSGRWVKSTPNAPRGGYRASSSGELPLVTRQEIAMNEYGPTPIPAYDVPMVVGVRSVTEQAHRISQLTRVRAHFGSRARDPLETQALTLLLAQLASADSGIDPIVDALCAADCALDAAQMIVAAMLAVPDPDSEDTDEMMMDDPADTTQPAAASGRRPDHDDTVPSPVAEDPRPLAHSIRLSTRIRAGLIARGVQIP